MLSIFEWFRKVFVNPKRDYTHLVFQLFSFGLRFALCSFHGRKPVHSLLEIGILLAHTLDSLFHIARFSRFDGMILYVISRDVDGKSDNIGVQQQRREVGMDQALLRILYTRRETRSPQILSVS
jgi:hypothetical protein